MKPVQNQEQEQQQNQTGRAPTPHFGIQLEMPARPAALTNTAPGKLPKMTTTLRAEVLATLLAGDDTAGLESVFSHGSTKLATVMRALTRRYHSPIERHEFPTNMADGRGAWVSLYVLPAETIASAFEIGAEAWIAEVRAARSRRLAAPARRSMTSPFGSTTNEQARLPESKA